MCAPPRVSTPSALHPQPPTVLPHTIHASSRRGELAPGLFDAILEGVVAGDLTADLVDAVDHGRVIAPAEGLADLDELHAEEVARQEHGHLARHGEALGAGL